MSFKRKVFHLFIIIVTITLVSCSNSNHNQNIDLWKEEIKNIEKAFNDMAQEEGIAVAFEHYIADDGVLMRNNELIQGKEVVSAFLEQNTDPNSTLTWTPTFIDVSRSGDMAYTYGDYQYTQVDSLGNTKEFNGVFHTVWKKQNDGSWKFVWD